MSTSTEEHGNLDPLESQRLRSALKVSRELIGTWSRMLEDFRARADSGACQVECTRIELALSASKLPTM